MPRLGSSSIAAVEDIKGAIYLAKDPLNSSNSDYFLRELVGTGAYLIRTSGKKSDLRTSMKTFGAGRFV